MATFQKVPLDSTLKICNHQHDRRIQCNLGVRIFFSACLTMRDSFDGHLFTRIQRKTTTHCVRSSIEAREEKKGPNCPPRQQAKDILQNDDALAY